MFGSELPLGGAVSFPAYFTLVGLGFVAAVALARASARRRGIDGRHMVDLALVCLAGALLGARLLSVLADGHLADFVHLCTDPAAVDAPNTAIRYCDSDADCRAGYLCNQGARAAVDAGARDTMCHPPRDCLAVLKIWQGGLTFYGGLLVAVPLGLWFARRRGIEPLVAADLATPALFLGLSIGRLGCFFEGCCYGAATAGPLGVSFPGLADPRHPTQLYESAVALALLAVTQLASRRSPPAGRVFALGLTLYAAARFVLELWRDDPRGALGPLSTSQLISIPLAIAGAILLWRSRRR